MYTCHAVDEIRLIQLTSKGRFQKIGYQADFGIISYPTTRPLNNEALQFTNETSRTQSSCTSQNEAPENNSHILKLLRRLDAYKFF